MAAKTRAEIKTLVEGHTGRTKDTLENTLCNDALKVALLEHNFRDAQSVPSDITITEDATSATIVTSDFINIVTARIVEASGTRNKELILKTRSWWDSHVINSEDNMKGWPAYGLRVASTIEFDRPAESGLELRLRLTTEQTFAADATVCPIYVLDKFVEEFVTAGVFAEIEDWGSYRFWIAKAAGTKWLEDGTVGGSLLKAIQTDSLGDTAQEIKSSDPLGSREGAGGVSVENLVTGHDDYGNTRWWN
jgi:hypothetical protein